jgi:alkylhydroperoxidase family enzyme
MTFPQRLPFPDLDNLTPDQVELRRILGPRRGGPNASKFMKLVLHFPLFLNSVGAVGARVSDNSSLPPRLFQLACMRTVWLCNAEYLWSQHRLASLKIGLTDENLYAVAAGTPDGGLTSLDLHVLRAIDELHFDHRFSDKSWTGFDEAIGPDAKIDIMLTYINYVACSAMTNSLGVPVEDGQSGFSPELLALKEKQGRS